MESSEKPAMRQQVSTSVLFFAALHGVHPAGQKSYRICTVEQYDNLLSTTAGACYSNSLFHYAHERRWRN